MSSKTFLTIISIIGLLFGAAFVLAPNMLADLYGVEKSPAAAMDARYFGAALLAWALISWLAREFQGEPLRAVLIGGAVGHTIGAWVTVNSVLGGVLNGLGWVSFVIFLFGASGCVYFLAGGSRRTLSA